MSLDKLDRLFRTYNLVRNTNLSAVVDENDGTTLSDLSAEQWLSLYDAYTACGWDFPPCRWTPK